MEQMQHGRCNHGSASKAGPPGAERLGSLRFHANLNFVTFQVTEPKKTVPARIALNRPYTYSLRCRFLMSGLNSLREKNWMAFNICLRFPTWDNHESEAGLVILSESKEGIKIFRCKRSQA